MNVYTITLEEIATGRTAPSMVTRQPDEAAARAYAEDALRQAGRDGELHVFAIAVRK
jgi:hypothetical protein